jgi:hypothetical protein
MPSVWRKGVSIETQSHGGGSPYISIMADAPIDWPLLPEGGQIHPDLNHHQPHRCRCCPGDAMLRPTSLRVARPTNDVATVIRFHVADLGLEIIDSFTDHQGFDGVMIGVPGAAWHLEFTSCAGHDAGRAPTQDNLLVFYLPDPVLWQAAVNRMTSAGHRPVVSFNPYWEEQGRTFEDPDGYRVVLQNSAWPA